MKKYKNFYKYFSTGTTTRIYGTVKDLYRWIAKRKKSRILIAYQFPFTIPFCSIFYNTIIKMNLLFFVIKFAKNNK